MVVLYTTNCPRCIVLEKKLKQKGIEFEARTDFDVKEMIKRVLLLLHYLKLMEKLWLSMKQINGLIIIKKEENFIWTFHFV